MEGDKMVLTFEGKPVTEMSREALIEALELCHTQISDLCTSRAIRARSLGHVEMIKRGEFDGY